MMAVSLNKQQASETAALLARRFKLEEASVWRVDKWLALLWVDRALAKRGIWLSVDVYPQWVRPFAIWFLTR